MIQETYAFKLYLNFCELRNMALYNDMITLYLTHRLDTIFCLHRKFELCQVLLLNYDTILLKKCKFPKGLRFS